MSATLRAVEGRCALRIQRRLTHPPAKVWRALTKPAHFSRWYPFPASEIDLRVDGRIRFGDGEGLTVDGVITEMYPPRIFAFSEGEDLLRFELRPDDEGCLLLLTHTFDDRAAVVGGYAAGWHDCLDALDAVLDGTPADAATHPPTADAVALNGHGADGV